MSLLDFLTSDDAQLGLGLLAAGGPSTTPMNFGQRISAGVGQAQANKDSRLRRSLMESQVAENASQAELRKQQLALALQKQQMDAYFMGMGGLMGGQPGTQPDAQPGADPTMGGAAAGPAPGGPGQPPGPAPALGGGQGGSQPAAGGFTAAQISQKFGVPLEAVISDFKFNGGKKIAELINDRTKPNWMTQGGNTFNTNQPGFQGGFMPSHTIAPSGQSLTTVPGPDGLPRVMPTPGALDAYRGFKDADQQSAANYDLVEIIDRDPNSNTFNAPIKVTRTEAMRRAAGGAQFGSPRPDRAPPAPNNSRGAGYNGGSAAAAVPEQVRILNSEMATAQREMQAAQQNGDAAGFQRAQSDMQAIASELRRLPGGSPRPMIGIGSETPRTPVADQPQGYGGVAVGLSPQEQARNEAERVRMVEQARADVARGKGNADANKRVQQITQVSRLAQQLLDKNPTASGAGSIADSALNFIGQPTASGTVAQQLEGLGGWLVANVPRMEGPQSDKDVLNYQTMAGRVGDRTLPVASRKAALGTLMDLQSKYAEINGGEVPAGPAAPALPEGWSVRRK